MIVTVFIPGSMGSGPTHVKLDKGSYYTYDEDNHLDILDDEDNLIATFAQWLYVQK